MVTAPCAFLLPARPPPRSRAPPQRHREQRCAVGPLRRARALLAALRCAALRCTHGGSWVSPCQRHCGGAIALAAQLSKPIRRANSMQRSAPAGSAHSGAAVLRPLPNVSTRQPHALVAQPLDLQQVWRGTLGLSTHGNRTLVRAHACALHPPLRTRDNARPNTQACATARTNANLRHKRVVAL